MSKDPVGTPDVPVGPVDETRRDGLARLLSPALTSAVVFGLLLGMIIVAVSTNRTATGQAALGQTGGASAVSTAGPFDIELGDLYVKPSSINVPAGAEVEVRVHNAGKQEHSLELDGKGAKMLKPGESSTVTWGPFNSSAKAWCTVAGHKDSGMVLDILVAGSTGGGGAAAAAGADDRHAKIDPAAKPAPDWKPFDPTVKPAPGGTRHDITFEVQEIEREVAPGVKQKLWTFNGQVPGPILRGKVGDLFNITLVNKGTMEHSIDFHASKVAPNVEMRTLKPGEKLVYQYQANFAGIFYYHCGADPMLYHIANGMYGAVIIDPPNLPAVDKEIVLTQAELYLGPTGQPGDVKKMHAEQADAVVFNGYANQYLYAPVRVDRGDRVRVWVVNAGINEFSSFHVIGTIFDTVYKEGGYLLQPNAGRGGSQALDLLPAQGGFVEFTLDRDGTYPFVNHKMAAAHKGAIGLFQVGAGQ